MSFGYEYSTAWIKCQKLSCEIIKSGDLKFTLVQLLPGPVRMETFYVLEFQNKGKHCLDQQKNFFAKTEICFHDKNKGTN